MKKKWWIILIIVVVVLWILRFFWYKLRSYVRDTTICQQKHSSCAAIVDTEYYHENHITCPICPTFWEYLIKWIKSLDINGVPDCCDRWRDRACDCGGRIIENGRACDCGAQPILD